MIDPLDPTRRRSFPCGEHHQDLLVPVYRGGVRIYTPPPLEHARAHRARQVSMLHAGLTRFEFPHQHPVGLERGASDAKTALILKMRGHDD